MTNKKSRLGFDPLDGLSPGSQTESDPTAAPEAPASGAVGRLLDRYQEITDSPVEQQDAHGGDHEPGLEARRDAPALETVQPPTLPAHLAPLVPEAAPLLDAAGISRPQMRLALEGVAQGLMPGRARVAVAALQGPGLSRESADFTTWALRVILGAVRSRQNQEGALTVALESLDQGLARLRVHGPSDRLDIAGGPSAHGEDDISQLGREAAARQGYLWLMRGEQTEIRLIFAI